MSKTSEKSLNSGYQPLKKGYQPQGAVNPGPKTPPTGSSALSPAKQYEKVFFKAIEDAQKGKS